MIKISQQTKNRKAEVKLNASWASFNVQYQVLQNISVFLIRRTRTDRDRQTQRRRNRHRLRRRESIGETDSRQRPPETRRETETRHYYRERIGDKGRGGKKTDSDRDS